MADLYGEYECMHGFLQLGSSVQHSIEAAMLSSTTTVPVGHEADPLIPPIVAVLLISPALALVLLLAWIKRGPKMPSTPHLDAISKEADTPCVKLTGETFVDMIFSKAAGKEKDACALKAWSEAQGVEQTMTYEELAKAVRGATKSLAKVGISPGDRVAFFCKGTLDFWMAFLGAQCVGATPVLLNWRQSKDNLQGMMDDCRVSWLVVGALHDARADLLDVMPASVKAILLLDGQLPKGASVDAHPFSWQTTTHTHTQMHNPAKLTRSNEAVIFFTSGSTSRPKPVLHTYETLMWTAENFVFPQGATQTLAFLPNFHVIMTLQNFLIPLARGMCVAVHTADGTQSVTATMLLKAAADLKPDVIDTVPFIMEDWSARSQEELQPLRHCALVQSGGAPLSTPVARALLESGVPVRQHYGQTEAPGIQLATVPGAGADEMSVFMPPWKMATVSLDGDGDEGELLIQGIQNSAAGNLSKGVLAKGSSKLEAAGHRTGDVFRWTTTASGQKGLAHCMRTDDTILLSTGEMFNPVPMERSISDYAHGVDNLKGALVAILGKNRPSPILVVEAPKGCGLDADSMLQKLQPAIDAANSAEVEYARIKPFYTCFLSPDTDNVLLAKTAKGNFIRGQSEKQLSETLNAVESKVAEMQTLQRLEKAKAAGFASVEEWLASTGAEDDLMTDSLGVSMQADNTSRQISQTIDNMKALTICSVLIYHFYFISRLPKTTPWVQQLLSATTETQGAAEGSQFMGFTDSMWEFFFAFGVMDGVQDGPSRVLDFFSSRTFAAVVVIMLYKVTRFILVGLEAVSFGIDGQFGIGTRSIWFVYLVLYYRACVRIMQMLHIPVKLQIGLTAAWSLQYMFVAGDDEVLPAGSWLLDLLMGYDTALLPSFMCKYLRPYGHDNLDSCEAVAAGISVVRSKREYWWSSAYDFFAVTHVVAYYYGEAVMLWFLKQSKDITSHLLQSNVGPRGENYFRLFVVVAVMLAAVGLNCAVAMVDWTPYPQWARYWVQLVFVTIILMLKIVASVGAPWHAKRIGGSSLGIYILHRYFPFVVFNWLIDVTDSLYGSSENGNGMAMSCFILMLLISWPILFCYIFGPTLQVMCLKPVTWIRTCLGDNA